MDTFAAKSVGHAAVFVFRVKKVDEVEGKKIIAGEMKEAENRIPFW